MQKIAVVKENLKGNFEYGKGMVAAEPAYILLAATGHPDAHEYVRKLTLMAQQQKKSFQDVLMNDAVAEPYLKKLTKQQLQLLQNPELYTGIAARKTEKVCVYWEKELRI